MGLSDGSNPFDFDEEIGMRELTDGNSGSGWTSCSIEMLIVNSIHSRVILHIYQEDLDIDQILDRSANLIEHSIDVFDYTSCLFFNIKDGPSVAIISHSTVCSVWSA